MEIASEFTVGAAPAEVYAALLDLERVGPCIPGASVGPAGSDGAHPAEIAVRLGPMRLTYRGTVRVVDHAAAALTATLVADVREVRGQGNAHARMTMSVTDIVIRAAALPWPRSSRTSATSVAVRAAASWSTTRTVPR